MRTLLALLLTSSFVLAVPSLARAELPPGLEEVPAATVPPPPPPPAPPPAPAPPVAVAASAPTRFAPSTGFAMELHLTLPTVNLSAPGYDNDIPVSAFAGGFMVGYRGNVITAGVGLDFSRIPDGSRDSAELFMVWLHLRAAVAHTEDARLELVLQTDLGLGAITGGGGGKTPIDVSFDIGLGPRYWLARHLALGGAALLRVDSFDAGQDDSDTLVGFTVELQMLAVF